MQHDDGWALSLLLRDTYIQPVLLARLLHWKRIMARLPPSRARASSNAPPHRAARVALLTSRDRRFRTGLYRYTYRVYTYRGRGALAPVYYARLAGACAATLPASAL